MALELNEHKRKTIEELYLKEDKSLWEVMKIMKEEYNFHASKSQYETLLKKWNLQKNLTVDEWLHIRSKLQAREELGKQSRVYLNNHPLPAKRLRRQLQRYANLPSAAISNGGNCHLSARLSVRSPSPIPSITQVEVLALDLLKNLPFLRFEEDAFDPLRLVYSPLPLGASTLMPFDFEDSGPPAGDVDELVFSEHAPAMKHLNRHLNCNLTTIFMESLAIWESADHNADHCGNREMVQMILPRLQEEIPEQYEGRFMHDLCRQHTISISDVQLYIIKFGLYLISNNRFADHEMSNFLKWILANGPRTISVLGELLAQKMTTVEACVLAIFRCCLPVGTIPEMKARLASDAGTLLNIPPQDVESSQNNALSLARVIVEAGDILSVDSVLKTTKGNPGRRPCFLEYNLGHDCIQRAASSENIGHAESILHSHLMSKGRNQEYSDMLRAGLVSARTAEMAQLFLDSGASIEAGHLAMTIRWHPDLALIRTYIREGADINEPNGNFGETRNPLMAALENGREIELIQTLIEAGADINYTDDNWFRSRTPLMTAVTFDWTDRKNSLELWRTDAAEVIAEADSLGYQTVELLLKCGAQVNMKDPDGATALQKAVQSDNLDVVRLLLQFGGKFTCTELMVAVENGNLDMVHEILKTDVDVNATSYSPYGSSALEVALSKQGESEDTKYEAILHVLVEHGADTRHVSDNRNRIFELLHAISRQDMRTFQYLQKIGVDVNQVIPHSFLSTALCAATERLSLQMVKLLLESGADVNAQADKKSCTALQISVASGSIDIVRILLDSGANPNAPCGVESSDKYSSFVSDNISGCSTALDVAINIGNLSIIELLLQAGADVNIPADYTHPSMFSWKPSTPLHRAVSLNDNTKAYKIAKLLLIKGAFLNVPPGYDGGSTILQAAIRSAFTSDDCSVADLLIEAGENINARAAHKKGRTALQIAVEENNLEIVQYLLSRGADINASAGIIWGMTALQVAVEQAMWRHDLQMVEFLLEKGADANGPPGYELGRSALQLATFSECIFPELIDRLLSAGANINLPAGTVAGLTALQGAAIQGHAKLVLRLLKLGADINAPGAKRKGRTALEGASEHGRLDTVQILLNAGADTHLPIGRRYQSALNLAEKNYHFTVAKLLMNRREEDLQNE